VLNWGIWSNLNACIFSTFNALVAFIKHVVSIPIVDHIPANRGLPAACSDLMLWMWHKKCLRELNDHLTCETWLLRLLLVYRVRDLGSEISWCCVDCRILGSCVELRLEHFWCWVVARNNLT
jgi:hypothetical protein